MTILILATGTTRNKHLLALEADYLKRLAKPWQVEVRELKASKHTNPLAARAEEADTQLTALKTLPAGNHPVLLHEHAPPPTTAALSNHLQNLLDNGHTPVFIIGGAAGFDDRVHAAIPHKLSLSPLTFPHQLCRLLLVEQLYRAHTLAIGHPYHRP